MVKVEFTVISTNRNGYGRKSWEVASKDLLVYLSQELSKIRCCEHGERPHVSVCGTHKEPKFEIQGCCKMVIGDAVKALS